MGGSRFVRLGVVGVLYGTAACAGIPDPPAPLALELPPTERAAPLEPPGLEERAIPLRYPVLPAPELPLPEPDVTWWPPRPLQASVVAIRITPPAGPPLEDVEWVRLAGEDVRVMPDGGSWVGIGALPLDSAGLFELEYAFRRGRDRAERRLLVPSRSRTYPSRRVRISARPSTPDPDVDARIERERALIRAALESSGATWHPEAPFRWPRQPPIKTSPFGQRRVFDGSVRSRHLGLDLRARYGNPIRAPAAGRVALTGHFFYQGKAVYLDHGLGLVTAYFHMSSIAVEEGDLVEVGDLLGRGGSTGRSTAPHLHWSAYVGGRSVDPETLIGLTLDGGTAGARETAGAGSSR